MPVNVPAMILNVAAGIAVWTSELPFAAKMVLTAILTGKLLLFLGAVWMCENERTRKICTSVCAMVNAALAIYGVCCAEYLVAAAAGVLLVGLILWAMAAVFNVSVGNRRNN